MTSHGKGMVAVLGAAVFLSTVPTAVKIGLAGAAPPMQLLAPRMALGAALLWIWIAATRRHRIRIDLPGLRACALAGAINAVSLSLFYLGLERVDASIAIVTFSIYPAILLLLLLARGEPVMRIDWWRLALALAGIWLVAGPGGGVDPAGVAMIFGTAVIYALYVLQVHTRLTGYPTSTQALWIVTFMAVAVQVPARLLGPHEALSSTAWLVVAWSGVLGTALSRVLTLTGIRLLGGGQTALLTPVETLMTVTWAALLLGDRLSAAQLLGALLVLASVALAALRGRALLRGGVPAVTVAEPRRRFRLRLRSGTETGEPM